MGMGLENGVAPGGRWLSSLIDPNCTSQGPKRCWAFWVPPCQSCKGVPPLDGSLVHTLTRVLAAPFLTRGPFDIHAIRSANIFECLLCVWHCFRQQGNFRGQDTDPSSVELHEQTWMRTVQAHGSAEVGGAQDRGLGLGAEGRSDSPGLVLFTFF